MSVKERREITSLARGGGAGVLVTLVSAAGSSYRQAGARLLALADGRFAGSISGGCLEADLLRRAHWQVRDGAVMQRYDTGFDDTSEIPFGLGCGGVVDLLLESAETAEAHALLAALEATLAGETRRVLTRLPVAAAPLARMVLDAAGDVLFASQALSTHSIVDLRSMALRRVPATAAVFVEDLQPAQRLVIFGAGEDARPLTRIAAELGWTIVVADSRPQHARPERFPQAHHVLLAASAAETGVTSADAVVLMTHSFEQDRRLLTQLLTVSPRYLGLLGARHRSALLLREAAADAHVPLAAALERTCAPIGLELGGEGPESIALAITAEVQATLQNAAHRRHRMSVAEAEHLLQRFGPLPRDLPMCALDGNLGTASFPAVTAPQSLEVQP